VERRHWPDALERALQRVLSTYERKGVVTVDQLNEALPADVLTASQIEEFMAALSDNGISVIEGSDQQDSA
jgi:RNA polymerase primary sigma factor